MDQKFQRIFLVRIEPGRFNHESLHIVVVCAFECKRLQRLHVDLRQQRVVHVCDWVSYRFDLVFDHALIYSPNLARRLRRHPREKNPPIGLDRDR
jgi:hypothetical protein